MLYDAQRVHLSTCVLHIAADPPNIPIFHPPLSSGDTFSVPPPRRLSAATTPSPHPLPPLSTPSNMPVPAPTGAYVLDHWIPLDIWTRLAARLPSIQAQSQFAAICRTAAYALHELRRPHLESISSSFHPRMFSLPDSIIDKIVTIHVVPPSGDGIILFIDESPRGGGVELAWFARGTLRTVPLGLDDIPATTVSNIRFSPDAKSIAFLITLAHTTTDPPQPDPLRRLRGLPDDPAHQIPVEFFPCDDCTVQVVDLPFDSAGFPAQLKVKTFTHVFVPEYGFDMIWRRGATGADELAFAAMLHSEDGAATYLVRWRNLRDPSLDNYTYVACIEGASQEFLNDRREAVMSHQSTIYTSRIELANDARHIFFDTMSKYGVLKFDQVDNADSTKVTRSDLPNEPIKRVSSPPAISSLASPSDTCSTCQQQNTQCCVRLPPASEITLRSGAIFLIGSPSNDRIKISRMSPDGRFLCSVMDLRQITRHSQLGDVRAKQVEMRSSVTGSLLFREVVKRKCDPNVKESLALPLEKSVDIAHHTMSFSKDSSLLLLWDTTHTESECLVIPRLPVVLDAATGGLVQDFGELSLTMQYETMQISPDAQTIYGTRMEKGHIVMDAIDVLSGNILKSVTIAGPVHRPSKFSAHSAYLLPDRHIYTVSRGDVDVLFDTTRGALGCGWRHVSE